MAFNTSWKASYILDCLFEMFEIPYVSCAEIYALGVQEGGGGVQGCCGMDIQEGLIINVYILQRYEWSLFRVIRSRPSKGK